MARTWFFSPCLLLAALALPGAAGCDGSEDPGAPGEPMLIHAAPPASPDGSGAGDGPGLALAISRVRLGRHDPAGASDEDAWETIGFDLDGVVTLAEHHATCAASPGATFEATLRDGHAGRDNSFGKNIVPMLDALAGSAEERTNDDIRNGLYTTLFSLDELGDEPEYGTVPAHVYEGAPVGPEPPAFDGHDVWSPTFESAPAGDPPPMRAPLHESYLADDGGGGTWVGRSEGVVTFRAAMSREPARDKVATLSVHRPIIAVHLDEERAAGTGTLTGYLRPGELHAEIRRVVSLHHPGACHGQGLDGLERQIEKAADILEDGSIDPEAPCDAISFGVAFEVIRVHLGPRAPPAPPPADPCH